MDESLPEIIRRIKKFKQSSKRFFRRGSRALGENAGTTVERAQDILAHLDTLIEKQQRRLTRTYKDFFRYAAQAGWTLENFRAALNRKVITVALIGTLAAVTPITLTGQTPPIRAPPSRSPAAFESLVIPASGPVVPSHEYDPRRTLVPTRTLAEASPGEARSELNRVLPLLTHTLTPGEEATLEQLLSKIMPAPIAAQLDGNRLPTTYGYIGAEQHLYRYPGDSLAEHTSDMGNQVRIIGRGVAPGLGAWGYFATGKASLTKEAIEREKWYIAAQTFLSPGWQERTNELYAWFKWRKIIVLDPSTGKTVIAVIGDAGPADWTGKKFGGSPELMDYMKLEDGASKREVIVLFVDDPGSKLPLGPIDLGLQPEGDA